MDCQTNLTAAIETKTLKYFVSVPSSFLFGVVICAESSLTIYINRKSNELRERSSTLFSNNLSLSNLFLGIYTMGHPLPRLVCSNLLGLDVTFWWHCLLSAVILHALHLVTMLNLVCIALDRYLYLSHPLRYYALVYDSRCQVLAVSTWGVSLLLLGPFALHFCITGEQPPLVRCNTGTGAGVPFQTAYTVGVTASTATVMVLYCLTASMMRVDKRRIQPFGDAMAEDQIAQRKISKEAVEVILFFVVLSLPKLVLQWLTIWLGLELRKWSYLLLRITHGLHVVMYLPVYGWCTSSFKKTLQLEMAMASEKIRETFNWDSNTCFGH